jgi:hypothetical protein
VPENAPECDNIQTNDKKIQEEEADEASLQNSNLQKAANQGKEK